VSNCNN